MELVEPIEFDKLHFAKIGCMEPTKTILKKNNEKSVGSESVQTKTAGRGDSLNKDLQCGLGTIFL